MCTSTAQQKDTSISTGPVDPVPEAGQTEFSWLVGISTFRCSPEAQSIVLGQQRAQLTHHDIYQPDCTNIKLNTVIE